jgi:hypothetical protein
MPTSMTMPSNAIPTANIESPPRKKQRNKQAEKAKQAKTAPLTREEIAEKKRERKRAKKARRSEHKQMEDRENWDGPWNLQKQPVGPCGTSANTIPLAFNRLAAKSQDELNNAERLLYNQAWRPPATERRPYLVTPGSIQYFPMQQSTSLQLVSTRLMQYSTIGPNFVSGGKEWEDDGKIVDDHDIHSVTSAEEEIVNMNEDEINLGEGKILMPQETSDLKTESKPPAFNFERTPLASKPALNTKNGRAAGYKDGDIVGATGMYFGSHFPDIDVP